MTLARLKNSSPSSRKRRWHLHFRVKMGALAVIITLAFQVGARIVDGTRAKRGEFPEVFALTMERTEADGSPENIGLCTATLIHPRVMLTAAHCADGKRHRPLHAVNGPTAFGDDRGIRVGIHAFGPHPRWVQEGVNRKSETQKEANDVAYLLLDRELNEITPAPVHAARSELQLEQLVGLPLTLIGYGQRTEEKPAEITRENTGIKSWSDGVVSNLIKGRLFRTGIAGNVHFGDSGGPAFVTVNGRKLLAGIISRSTPGVTEETKRLGIFSALRADHLCWVQNETQVDLGLSLECSTNQAEPVSNDDPSFPAPPATEPRVEHATRASTSPARTSTGYTPAATNRAGRSDGWESARRRPPSDRKP